jgi:hypothetical protein
MLRMVGRLANVGGRQYEDGLPDAALILVGRITLAGAELEDRLTDLIAILVAPPGGFGPVQYLIHHDPMSLKLERMRLLTESTMRWGGREMGISPARAVVPEGMQARIGAFIAEANQARKLRNDVVHSDWWTAQDDSDVFLRRSLSSRTNVVQTDELVTAAHLQQTLDALLEVIKEGYAIWSELFSAHVDAQTGDQ